MFCTKSSITILSLAALAASAVASNTFALRGLTAHATHATPMMERVCNATELDAHLDTLTDKAECGEVWTKFSDDIVSEDFDKLSLEEKTKALDTFCQTPCGPSFNKAAADWRAWCDNNEGAFLPIGNDDDVTYTFDGFVAEFGCSKSAAGDEGQYCAKIVMDEMNSEPHDMAPKCTYYSSCCFGEMHRMVELGDMARHTVSLEEKCPGTRDALASKCAV